MKRIAPESLLKNLVYLDTGYVSDLYEIITGEIPKTVITRNQGKKAGASVQVFSAEVSAQETRSYTVSTLQMLAAVMETLEREPALETSNLQPGTCSKYGWIAGELSAFKVESKVIDSKSGEHKILASDAYFQLHSKSDFPLVTTPEYFAPGFATFLKMQQTALKEMKVPVRAYVRVPAARDHMSQWVAIPLLIVEQENGG